MNTGRGIVNAFCMARPRRCEGVSALIAEAMAAFDSGLSKRSRARILARRVVAELVAEHERTDQLEIVLSKARLLLGADAALQLALHPGLDLVAEFERIRCDLFRARGCRQLPATEWQAETAQIATAMEARLAERFRR